MEKYLTSKNVIVFIVALILIALSIFSLDIILLLFGAFIITSAINPIINKLETKMPRILAVTLVLLGLLIVTCLVLVPLISVTVDEISNLVNVFSNYLDKLDVSLNFKIFDKNVKDLITFDSIKEPVAQGIRGILTNSIEVGKIIANTLTSIFAIAIIVFYATYDEKRLIDKFIEFFPRRQKKKASEILNTITQKVGNYVIAQGIAMLYVGVFTAIGLLIIGNSHALILGFITCVLDIIPVIGPAIAVIIGLLTSLDNGLLAVSLTALVFVLAQWSQNQLLRPVVFGKLLDMHPLVIIFALLIAARFLGLFGVILAPAIACVICVLVDELYLKKINKG